MMKLSNSKDAVKCLHDKGNGRCREKKGSRKNRLVKLFSLMLAAVLMATAVVSDIGMETVKADTYGIMQIAAPSDNLEDYIKGMTLQKRNAEGDWVDLESGEDIVLGNNYKLNVHFEAGTGTFKNPMHWSLGENVKCEPKNGAPVMNGSVQVGTYDLDEEGNVTVYFYDDYLKNANQVLDMEFEMVPTNSEGEGEHLFPWSGHIKDHKIVNDVGDLAVQKKAGSYDADKGTITYTVEASVTKGMVTNGKLEDVMGEGLTFYDVNSMKVFDADGQDVTASYQDYIDALTNYAENHERKGEKGLTLEPLPPLSEGMSFVVEYESSVDEANRKDKTYTAENTVTFSGKKPSGENAEPKDDSAEKDLSKDQLSKIGNVKTIEEENGETKDVIQWQVKVGSGQWDPFDGIEDGTLTLKDTLGKGLAFYKGDKIQVVWCDKEGNPKGSSEIDWGDVTISSDGKSADYDIKSSMFEGYDWKDGDYIIVTYYTTYDSNNQPYSGFENTVENQILKPGDKATGRVPIGEAIQKKVIDNEEKEYLTYTVTVDVPPASQMKSMLDDEEDGHAELDLPYYYIEDRLDFSDYSHFVLNVPENVTIYVESKDGTYKEWFKEMPCTSGSGDPSITERTFQILQGAEDNESGGREHRAFRIYFNVARYGIGTDNTLEHHDSIWDIDVPTRMTITYRIPYDATVVDLDGKVVEETLGELLMQGKQLDNKALAKRSGSKIEDEVSYKKTPKAGGIDKSAHYLGEGVVEYKVSFLNRYTDSEGTYNFIGWSDSNQWLRYGKTKKGPITVSFEDEFDERMEYVEDSLYVEVQNASGVKYATYKYTGSSPVIDPPNKLVADILNFGEQISNDGDHYISGESIGKTFDSNGRKYVFVYKLRLKEEYRSMWDPADDIENTAVFKYGDESLQDSTTIDIPSDMLQKKYTLEGNGIIKYTLNVNSAAANLVTVETETGVVNLDSYRLEDKMTDNLELIRLPDGDYDITVEYKDENGNWIPLTRSPNTTDISKDKVNYYRGIGDDGKLYFILPDELAIQITYRVFVNGPINSQQVANNTATLYADQTETEQKSVVVEVGKSGATASSDPPVHLQKTDASDLSLLQGAEFTLYSSEGSSDSENFIEITQENVSVKMYPVETYTTDKFGKINNIIFPNATDPDLREKVVNALYALKETKAPDGYILNPIPQFFRFPGANNVPDNDIVFYLDTKYDVRHMDANETFLMTNEKKRFLRILKTDDEKKMLPGAEFALFECTADGDTWKKGVEKYTGLSDEDGVIKWTAVGDSSSTPKSEDLLDLVTDLPDGIYYLEETGAPAGYKKLEDPIIIEVTNGFVSKFMQNGENLIPDEESLKEVTLEGEEIVTGYAMIYAVKNEKQIAKFLRIVKTNMSSAPLQNAKFGLYASTSGDNGEFKEGELLWEGTSSTGGIVLWNRPGETPEADNGLDRLELSPGIYFLKEIQAPDGYNMLGGTLTVTVKEDGTEDGTISITGSDVNLQFKKVPEEDGTMTIAYNIPNSNGYTLPETGGHGYAYLYLLGCFFAVFGAALLLNKKRACAK